MPSEMLDLLADKAIRRHAPTREEARALLAGTEPLIDVVAAGARVRREFFGNRVKLNTIINMKSGLCPEDCGYCSQRVGSSAEVLKYSWIRPDKAAEVADAAIQAGAKRVCLVASGRGPADRDLTRIENTIAAIKSGHPHTVRRRPTGQPMGPHPRLLPSDPGTVPLLLP